MLRGLGRFLWVWYDTDRPSKCLKLALYSDGCSVKNKFSIVNAKCGHAKIYGLRLEFSNYSS